jgi:hypothetical protein
MVSGFFSALGAAIFRDAQLSSEDPALPDHQGSQDWPALNVALTLLCCKTYTYAWPSRPILLESQRGCGVYRYFIWSLWVWFLLVAGCSSHRPGMENSALDEGVFFIDGRIYPLPYREAYERLRKRLDDLGYDLARADRDAGVIATLPRPLSASEFRYCDCRNVGSFYQLGRKVRMTFIVEDVSPESTRVTVRSRFIIFWSDGFRTIERSCASTGKLERTILKLEGT